ncbi:hypothetical protein ACOMHN_053121 [Nucella lapillus]
MWFTSFATNPGGELRLSYRYGCDLEVERRTGKATSCSTPAASFVSAARLLQPHGPALTHPGHFRGRKLHTPSQKLQRGMFDNHTVQALTAFLQEVQDFNVKLSLQHRYSLRNDTSVLDVTDSFAVSNACE